MGLVFKSIIIMLYLSLGSNLGDRERYINDAIGKIGERIGRVIRISSFYSTEPWGFESENNFVNAAVAVETDKDPHEILDMTKAIETELGRQQKSENGRYHDRTIDIDILIYDGFSVNEPDLKIPHPLMHERDFVMRPLKEIIDKAQDKCRNDG